MTRTVAAASLVALLCSGGQALAQYDGLDLSDDDKPKDDASDGLDLSSTDSSSTSGSDAPVAGSAQPAEKKSDGLAVERDISQDDRVKSVQRKLYLKRNRVELAPYFVINVNDAYYTKMGFAGRVAFYPADSLAISARFTWMTTLKTDDVRTATRVLNSRIFHSEPMWTVMADLEWSPFYGKVAIFNSILHFDAYVLGGGGIVTTRTSILRDVNGNETGLLPKPAFDLGLGFRFVARDFLAINVSLTNSTYGDTPVGTTKAITQNLMMINVGLSLFLPFKSTYREDE